MDRLVSHDWLAAHLADTGVVVLDATLPPVGGPQKPGVFARYLDCHIPGAVFFDIETLSYQATDLPHMLPTPSDFARNMSALGVSNSAHIVVYEQQGVFSAPRAWWMFRTFGARRVSVLDGDLNSWIEAGHPTASGPVHRPAAEFTAALDYTFLADLAAIKAVLARHGQVLDARSAARFEGTAHEPRPGLNSGHMPGAISLPYTELVHDGRLLPSDQLRAAFTTRGIELDRPITTTCGSGVTAAVLALALDLAGARQITLYDGSWAEYARQPDALIATGSAHHAVA